MSKFKHILIVTGIFPPEIGGPASYGMTLAKKLAKNFSVTIITYSRQTKYAADKELPFKVFRISQKIPKFLRHFVFFLKILKVAPKVDLIFSLNAVSAGWPALTAARLRKKKFVVKIVGDYAWETAVGSGRSSLLINDFQKTRKNGWIGILHKIQTSVCQRSDKIIVPSKYLAGLVAGWGVEPKKIEVVYNGVDFKPLEISKEEARKKIGIAGNIILSIGRLVPWKGFRMLVKIMPRLLALNPYFRLVIVGDGPEFKLLSAMAKNLNLHNKVYLVGKKNKQDLALYLAAAEIFVLNTGYEGFSHQILETMAAGVPVITTNVGGNREAIHQGENGFMIKYNDEFNLTEAIKTVWLSAELKEHFIGEGKKTVEQFSVEKMLKQTEEALVSL